MDIRATKSGKTAVLNATAEELAELKRAFRLATMQSIGGVPALVINDAPVVVERYIERRRPVILDWHDADACDAFRQRHLAGPRGEWFHQMTRQLRVTEGRADVRPSRDARRLAEKLATHPTVIELEAYIKEQL